MGRRLVTLGVPGGGLPAYYVDGATGNDTTGAGTAALPWATISKALATIPDVECAILVNAGTYVESTAGVGYLNITRNAANPVTVRPWHAGDSVIITDDTNGSYTVRLQATKVNFKDVSIVPTGATTTATVSIENGTTTTLDGCTITGTAYAVRKGAPANVTLIIQNCTISKRADIVGNVYGIYVATSAGVLSTVYLYNNTVTGNGTFPGVQAGINAGGTLNLVMVGGTYTGTAAPGVRVMGGNVDLTGVTSISGTGIGLQIGSDGISTLAMAGTLTNCIGQSTSSHCLLVGGGVDGLLLTGCTGAGGDYGIVVKECLNVTLSGCTGTGGTKAGLYFKGAHDCAATLSTLSASVAAQNALLLAIGDAPESHKVYNITATDNTLIATGAANCLLVPDATEDDGGDVFDRNTYDVSASSGAVGSVYGTGGIDTLLELQGAWSMYDVPTNDANSTVVAPA